MEVEVRRRTAIALAKAASLQFRRLETEEARLLLDESLIMHQVCRIFPAILTCS